VTPHGITSTISTGLRRNERLLRDASYYIALLNRDDEAHSKAVAVTVDLDSPIITTAWVLAELGGHLSAPADRPAFIQLVTHLRQDPDAIVLPADQRLFDAGLDLFARRRDKHWSLVDCISFCVMSERGLMDALSTDSHFEQAGFRILLK
jgi:predicted nucleic acid-binding protein